MTVLHVEPATGLTVMEGNPMSRAVLDQFAADPLASHSARFPLGRNAGPVDLSAPSAPRARPWGLGGMRPSRQQGDPLRAVFTYDHDRQIALDPVGKPLTMAEPTANKVTSNDGDEGPSEDFTYDYCPDSPLPA
ncbi:MAG: putative ATP-grasp-modified RiPP [Pseudonocardia sp.]